MFAQPRLWATLISPLLRFSGTEGGLLLTEPIALRRRRRFEGKQKRRRRNVWFANLSFSLPSTIPACSSFLPVSAPSAVRLRHCPPLNEPPPLPHLSPSTMGQRRMDKRRRKELDPVKNNSKDDDDCENGLSSLRSFPLVYIA